MRVLGAPLMILPPVFSIFPVLHCPLGPAKLQACPFPDVIVPPLPLSALSSSPFHCALQDGFGQTWWTGDMTIPLQFASLYNGQEVFVWSNCLLDHLSCRIGKQGVTFIEVVKRNQRREGSQKSSKMRSQSLWKVWGDSLLWKAGTHEETSEKHADIGGNLAKCTKKQSKW